MGLAEKISSICTKKSNFQKSVLKSIEGRYEGGYLRNTLRGGVIFYFYHRNQLVPGFGLKIEYVIDETEL